MRCAEISQTDQEGYNQIASLHSPAIIQAGCDEDSIIQTDGEGVMLISHAWLSQLTLLHFLACLNLEYILIKMLLYGKMLRQVTLIP